MSSILVIYHAHCNDGLASAWVIYNSSTKLGWPKTKIDYKPLSYDSEIIETNSYDDIYIVDFSFDYQILLKMLKTISGKIVLLDHHESALEKLKDKIGKNKRIEIVLDSSRSGCQITWDYFNKNISRPWFINYVGDRDLWLFKMDCSKEVNLALNVDGYTNNIDNFNKLKNKNIENFKIRGKHYLVYQNSLIVQCSHNVQKIKYENYNVGLIQSNVMISELGNYLTEKFDFVILWRYQPNYKNYGYSLRTNKDDINMNKICEKFGGGGHQKAAGFSSKSSPMELF